jgi:hypothetical protein
MSENVRRFSEKVVKAHRAAWAMSYLGWAGLFVYIGLYFFGIADGSWWLIGLAILFGYWAMRCVVSAAETYIKVEPFEPADMRMRRLESRSLYLPQPRRSQQNRQADDR